MKIKRMEKNEQFNFTTYLLGRSISVLMSSVYTFAIGLYVLKMTGSGLSFAVTLSLQILPTVLVGPLAGVLADRFDKKLMVVLTDALSGALFLTLFFLSAGGLTLLEIYAATLLLSTLQALYNVCIDSAVPDIVAPQHILALNSFGKIVDSSAMIVSPVLGGILYAAADIRLFVLLNGTAFLLSTLKECLIDFRLSGDSAPLSRKLDLKNDLAEGVAYIRKTKWIRTTLLNFLAVNIFVSLCYSVPVPFLLNNVFRLSAKTYGIVQCFLPVGMIAGALAVKRLSGSLPYGRLIAGSGMLCALCLFLFGVLPALAPNAGFRVVAPVYAVLLVLFGLVISLVDIPFLNNFQTRIPEEMRGRALSISVSAVKIFTPVGYLAAGGLLSVVPAFCLPLCGGALLSVCYLAARRDLRGLL